MARRVEVGTFITAEKELYVAWTVYEYNNVLCLGYGQAQDPCTEITAFDCMKKGMILLSNEKIATRSPDRNEISWERRTEVLTRFPSVLPTKFYIALCFFCNENERRKLMWLCSPVAAGLGFQFSHAKR